MTVRLLVPQNVSRQSDSRRRYRWAEYALLFLGLIALDCFIWVNVDTSIGQAYDNWSLDRQIQGYQPSLRGFVADKLEVPWLAPADVRTGPEGETEAGVPVNGKGQPEKSASRTGQRNASAAGSSKGRLPESTLIGRVAVPRLRLSATVREGVDDATLRKAVGHMPTTALPGQPGNVALAAHRDTLFRKLRDIRKRDKIVLETVDNTYDYLVESTSIVMPDDLSVIQAEPGDQLLTLITCYPFNYIGSAPKRFIVRARQVNVTAQAQALQRP